MNIENMLLAVTLSNIFFLSTGLAGVSFGYASEICAILLVLVMTIGARRFAKNFFQFLVQGNNAITLVLVIYIIADSIDFWVMGHKSLAWQKYRVTAVLLFLFVSLCVLHCKKELSKLVLFTVGFAAVVVSIYTLAQYFLPLNLPLFYIARFSLRRDYNMYATLLLTGLICLVFGALKLKSKSTVIVALVPIPTVIAITILSGSRRVLILLPVMLTAMATVLIVLGIQRVGANRLGEIIACLFIVVIIIFGETSFLKQNLDQLNKTQGETRSITQSTAVETQLIERYETIHSSSLLKKRKVIWGLAVQELSNFSQTEMIFGRGGGENILLYDRIQKPLDTIYPDRQARLGALSAHNMLLADLLDGGIIKLIALLCLAITIAITCIVIALKRPLIGLPIGMVLAICMINSMVSNRFGLLYDRFFIIFAALVVIEYNNIKIRAQAWKTRGE